MKEKQTTIKKTISTVKKNETLVHTGDLMIEGDVEAGAQIKVTEGGLWIKGNVQDGAVIYVFSEKLSNANNFVKENSSFGDTTTKKTIFDKKNNTVANGSITGVYLMMDGKNFMIGARINKRILTDDVVIIEKNNRQCTIVASHPSLTPEDFKSLEEIPSNKEFATITIDDQSYQGKMIKIDGDDVWVDDKKILLEPNKNFLPVTSDGLITLESIVFRFNNVNIGGRILTDNIVLDEENGKYTIFASHPKFSIPGIEKTKKKYAKVTIDGQLYQGKIFEIDGTDVWVDGKKILLELNNNNTKETKENDSPPVVIIHGNIGHNVYLASAVDITVHGNIGNFCKIYSLYAGLKACDVGKETLIRTRGLIEVGKVDEFCKLISFKDGVNAFQLAKNIFVKTRKSTIIRNSRVYIHEQINESQPQQNKNNNVRSLKNTSNTNPKVKKSLVVNHIHKTGCEDTLDELISKNVKKTGGALVDQSHQTSSSSEAVVIKKSSIIGWKSNQNLPSVQSVNNINPPSSDRFFKPNDSLKQPPSKKIEFLDAFDREIATTELLIENTRELIKCFKQYQISGNIKSTLVPSKCEIYLNQLIQKHNENKEIDQILSQFNEKLTHELQRLEQESKSYDLSLFS